MKLNLWIPIALATMCALAMLPGMPYGYFTLTRWAVCCGGGFMALQLAEAKLDKWAFACAALALLFNPLVVGYFETIPENIS